MTNDEIRRYRLNELIEQHGTVAALGRFLGISSAQISQWRNASPDSKTGKPRTISDGAARRLETACSKERGWMDTPPLAYSKDSDGQERRHGAMELVPAPNINQAEIKAQARSLSQRAHAVAAMWMQLQPERQDEVENTLRHETGAADESDAATTVSTGKRKRNASRIKTGND